MALRRNVGLARNADCSEADQPRSTHVVQKSQIQIAVVSRQLFSEKGLKVSLIDKLQHLDVEGLVGDNLFEAFVFLIKRLEPFCLF